MQVKDLDFERCIDNENISPDEGDFSLNSELILATAKISKSNYMYRAHTGSCTSPRFF